MRWSLTSHRLADQQHSTVEEKKSATIGCIRCTNPVSSWRHLAGALHNCREDKAVAAVKTHPPNGKGMRAWDSDMNHSPYIYIYNWTSTLVMLIDN